MQRPGIFNSTWQNFPRVYLVLCLAFSVCKQVSGQETTNVGLQEWTLISGIHVSKINVIDKTFSSAPYAGNSLGGLLAIKFRKKRSFHELHGYYTKGNLKADTHGADKLKQTYMNADYTWLYKPGINDHPLLVFKTGAGINVLYASRNYRDFINNDESFEFSASLSGVVEVSYFFDRSQAGFSISNRTYLPVVSFIAQPVFGNEGTTGNSKVASFSSFFRVLNLLSLEKRLSARQVLSLFYTWDYYQFRYAGNLKQVAHGAGLTYGFSF